jgi:hypothetical protein
MANNKRVFWAVQGVVIGEMGETTVNTTPPYADKTKLNPVHGLQSVGITTTFNLEQVFEMGQLALYENVEDVPDVEVTLEKVIDGYPLLYHLATSDPALAAGTDTLVGRSNAQCDLRMGVYSDTASEAGGSNPQSEVYCSGMYVSSVRYTFPVDGNATESCTLVGNHKQWYTANAAGSALGSSALGFGTESAPSGVTRRQHINMTASNFPPEIPGIGADGQMDSMAVGGSIQDNPLAHIQNVTVSADLGREVINELGHKGPYCRYVSWPVEVTTEIEVVTSSGDYVNALPNDDNLTDRAIYIAVSGVSSGGGGAGLVLDLGSKNKLTSVSYSGADTGGGNATTSFSYSTFNDLTVFHVRNPTNG